MAITYKAARWTKRLGYETSSRTNNFSKASQIYETWKKDPNTKRAGIIRYEFGTSEIIISTS